MFLSSFDPTTALWKSIVIRAIKDYQYTKFRREVMDWVVEMEETFPMCAESMDMSVYMLREIMVDKMIEIDTTHVLFKDKEARMR